MSEKRQIHWTAAELLTFEFPPILWLVDGLLTTGLTVLAGAPKLGKSWLVLAIAYAVSIGGAVLSKIKVPQHRVLYLALEDNARRLQSRLLKIGAKASDHLHICLEWKRGAEGVADLRRWLEKYPDTKLIVIDTWGRFSRVSDGNDYNQVTDAAAELKSIADEYDISILMVHHTRKQMVDDWMDGIMGSTGLAAAADSAMVLKRGRGKREAVLSVTGRDINEAEYVLAFDNDTGTWALIGTTSEVQETTARQEIFDWLKENGPSSPKAVHDGMKEDGAKRSAITVRRLLREMEESGAVSSLGGVYTVKSPETREQHEPVNITKDPNTHEPREHMNSSQGSKVHEFTEFTPLQGGNDDSEEIPLF